MSPGVEAPGLLRGALKAAKQRSRAWQADQFDRTGFATDKAELGHAVVNAMRRRGYPVTVASVAGHLAAVGTAYNWQGNARIADLVGRSERTVQRVRARLEDEGLIASKLLLTGDMIAGQRSPVRHPQVVRDVSRLQRLASVRQAALHAPTRTSKRRRPTAIEVPPPPPQEEMTAEGFEQLARDKPEFATFLRIQAEAKRRQGPPPPPQNAAHITSDEIDEWERATATAEMDRQQQQRAPPTGRGPPRR